MQQYVAGLLFDDEGSRVALVLKNRPQWQAGNYNAIGGKVEPDESFAEAMAREFAEEAGVEISDWEFEFSLWGPGVYQVFFYSAFSTEALEKVSTIEDEPIHILDPLNLPANTIFNIRWIIPLILDQTVAKPDSFECPTGS